MGRMSDAGHGTSFTLVVRSCSHASASARHQSLQPLLYVNGKKVVFSAELSESAPRVKRKANERREKELDREHLSFRQRQNILPCWE